MAGQNLIRASELRAVTTEFKNLQTAAHTFRDKYFALPGDMRNAEAFWGTMTSGTCPNATGGAGTQTCNGNGDGQITGSGAASQTNETFTFFQHLANAGLIEGSYTGLSGSGGQSDAVVGTNVPRSKLGQAGWWATYQPLFGDGNQYRVNYGNYYQFGYDNGVGSTGAKTLKPEEAWNIDTKLDDGKPGQGKVIAKYWDNACADATSNTDYDSDYRLTDTAEQCALYFTNLF